LKKKIANTAIIIYAEFRAAGSVLSRSILSMRMEDVMKKSLITWMGALALSSSAFAAGIAPPNSSFSLTGGGNLVKNGNNGWVCAWTFNGQTGLSVGGSPPRAAGGTMTGGTASGVCSVMTVAPSTFSITSSDANGGAGVFHGLNFKESGFTFCSTTGDVPFHFFNNGTGTSDVFFDSASIGFNCVFAADLKTVPDLNVVP
jgi:hypothetical protein